MSQWSHRDRVRSCEISQHPGRALGFAEVVHWLLCSGSSELSWVWWSSRILWLFLNQAGKNYSRWAMCTYEIGGRLLRCWILLHIVLCGNIIVNLSFLLTWQTKGAVSFHTQAFTGAGVSIRDQIFRSVYVLKKKIRLDVGAVLLRKKMLNYYSFVKEEMLNYYFFISTGLFSRLKVNDSCLWINEISNKLKQLYVIYCEHTHT